MFGKVMACIVVGVIGLAILGFTIGYSFVPSFRFAVNDYFTKLEKIDQETDYTNRKMVEDSARSMISNYEYAKGEYETYKMFCETEKYDENKCQRSIDSKTSANKTASTYNNYMLKNNYLFKGNMPSDIYYQLQTLN